MLKKLAIFINKCSYRIIYLKKKSECRPFANTRADRDGLLHSVLNLKQSLFKFVNIVHSQLELIDRDTLLDNLPDFIV